MDSSLSLTKLPAFAYDAVIPGTSQTTSSGMVHMTFFPLKTNDIESGQGVITRMCFSFGTNLSKEHRFAVCVMQGLHKPSVIHDCSSSAENAMFYTRSGLCSMEFNAEKLWPRYIAKIVIFCVNPRFHTTTKAWNPRWVQETLSRGIYAISRVEGKSIEISLLIGRASWRCCCLGPVRALLMFDCCQKH